MVMVIAAKAPTGRHHASVTKGRHAKPKGLHVATMVKIAVILVALYFLRHSMLGLGFVAGLTFVLATTRLLHHEGDRHRKIDTEDPISRFYMMTVAFDFLVVFLQSLNEETVPPVQAMVPVFLVDWEPSLRYVPVQSIVTDQKLIERFDSLRIGGEPKVIQGSWQRG